MTLEEEFEVKFKDKNNPQQIELLKNAIKDLYLNIEDYEFVVKGKNSKNEDQTTEFLDKFYISNYDVKCMIEDYAFCLKLSEYADILIDRDRENNLLYILYVPNAIVGNWDYKSSEEKLIYIKWNPLNRKILSFHTMKKIKRTNRDKLKEENRLNENLSLQQIRSKDVYSGNDHVNKFFNIRKSLIGNPNKNVKFITSELNSDGSADFLFQTVTTPYDEENHVYKELEDAPISDTINSSELINNIANEYMMCIRVNDFWDLIEELEIVEQNEFDKNTLASILDLSEDVKYSCNCPSFVFTGVSYFATLENASLIPNNIYPKKWDKYRMNALCCKHLSGLFRNLSFFENQMAMSIKKNMIDQGLLY